MSTKTTNSTPENDRPAASSPAERSTGRPYQPAMLAKFNRVLNAASDEELAFLDEFLNECSRPIYDAWEVAYVLGNRECGFGWLSDPDNDRRNSATLKKLDYMLTGPGWLPAFLGLLCQQSHDALTAMTPEDVLEFLTFSLNDYQGFLDAAKDILRDSPQVLRDEIRETVRKHPEFAPDNQKASAPDRKTETDNRPAGTPATAAGSPTSAPDESAEGDQVEESERHAKFAAAYARGAAAEMAQSALALGGTSKDLVPEVEQILTRAMHEIGGLHPGLKSPSDVWVEGFAKGIADESDGGAKQ
jgi:hypothetical protein